MSVLKSLLGWLVEPASERSVAARHSRRMSREQSASQSQEKRERREDKARDREERQAEKQQERTDKLREANQRLVDKRRDDAEKKAERDRERDDKRRDDAEAKKERREREDRLRKERKEEKRARRTAGIIKSIGGAIKEKRSRKNPKGEAGGLGRLDAGDKQALETAQRMSQQFHGTPDQVVELDAEERRLPRFAVVVGDAKKIAYEAPAESKRAGILWEHESGDRGDGKPRSSRAPLLLADPATPHMVFTVKNKSPMRFSSKQGIIG